MTPSSDQRAESERVEIARRLLDEHLHRQSSEGPIREADLVAAYPDLMPELGRELQKLKKIKLAKMIAESTSFCIEDLEAFPSPGAASPFKHSLPTDSFPGYMLKGEIHRGGQGVVYRAVQDNTKREVAIKVMRGGPFAGVHDQARFEREVQILGQLQHPNIVAIHESGSEHGSSFFVMDYIPGHSLDEYVKHARLTIDQTLELFAVIADAVNVAHLRGIIHRDLKPGNIRVNQNGEPRILDFGLAKVTQLEEAGNGMDMTVTGQFIGSMPWTSPEQARGEAHTIDIRSDVYSLGAILYQLLTDRLPLDVEGSINTVLQRIINEEPARPHTIRADINDEIETILLKCLSKEPERRYQSAGELARDIRNYLAGDPIEAKRDSTWYVLRKTARRYRVPIAIAIAFMVLMTASSITFAVLFQYAKRQEQLAEQRRAEIQEEVETSRQVLASLGSLFQTLDPSHFGRTDVTIREVLDTGVNDVVAKLEGKPEVLVQAMEFVAETYESHGYYESAVPWRKRILTLRHTSLPDQKKHLISSIHELANVNFQSADYSAAEALYQEAIEMGLEHFGERHLLTATYKSGLGILLHRIGRFEEAEVLLDEALAVRLELLGDMHPTVAGSLTNLALLSQSIGEFSMAEEQLRKALEIRQLVFGDDHLDVAKTLNQLAATLRRQSRYTEAESMIRQVLEIRTAALGERHLDVASSLHELGTILKDMSRYDEAEPHYQRALVIRREVLGNDHPEVAFTLNNLANLKETLGAYDEAIRMHEDALAIHRARLGPQHPQVATGLHNLARVWATKGDVAKAESLYGEALAIRRQLPNHPDVALTLKELASLLPIPDRYDDALALLQEAIELLRRQLGDTHRDVANTLNTLAILHARVGHHDQAVESMTEALSIYRSVFADDHLYVGVICGNLAGMMLNIDADAEAEPLFREALRIHRDKLSESHERTVRLESTFGKCLTRLAQYDDAETLLLHCQKTLEQLRGLNHRLTQIAVRRLVDLYDAWGKPDKATEWRAKLELPDKEEETSPQTERESDETTGQKTPDFCP